MSRPELPGKCDVLVVGAGLSGLTAASRLALAGREVVVAEQHYAIGGLASSFRRKAQRFEVGLHAINGFLCSDPRLAMWESLNLHNYLKCIRLPYQYRAIWRDLDIRIPHGPEELRSCLHQRFPTEFNAIEEYLKLLGKTYLNPAYALSLGDLKVKQWLDGLTSNQALQIAILANLGYYHDNPFELSLSWFALGQASFCYGGSSFIHQGSAGLTKTLMQNLKDLGKVYLRCSVESIRTPPGSQQKVVHLNYAGQTRELQADHVILACSANEWARLLDSYTEVSALSHTRLKKSPSLTSLYAATDKGLSQLGWKDYCTIRIHDDSMISLDGTLKAVSGYTLIDYSQIDHGLGGQPYTLCQIDEISAWPEHNSNEYQERKVAVTEGLQRHLETLIPGARAMTFHTELATPRTILHFTRNAEGAVYGLAQTPQQSGVRRPAHQTEIPGLWLSSAWARPGGGFMGAMLSGWNAAGKVLGSNLLK